MRRFFLPLLFALILAGCDTVAPDAFEPRSGRGAIVSVTPVLERSAAQVQAELDRLGAPLEATYDVEVYTVVYETVDAHGATTRASGALMAPRGAPGPRPLVSHQHGTLVARRAAPSAGGERVVGLAFASAGYVAALPDLLGLGQGPGRHPYVHAGTAATAVVDMLRAVRSFAARRGPLLNDQLFLVGYSQGGYTAMAAHRAIEASYAGEFRVTASAPLAGPYDLSGVMTETFLVEQPHPDPYYLPFAALAYNDIYDLYDDPSEFLAPPYDTLLPPLFDGEHGGGAINAVMPEFPVQIFKPAFVEAFRTDPNHPLRARLRENDVYDWTPQAPVRMLHCAGDRHVPQANARVALDRFWERGAEERVSFFDPLPSGDHAACAAPSLVLARLWFDSMLEE